MTVVARLATVTLMQLRIWLQSVDKSPREFAREIGVSRTNVYKYLRGERRPRDDVMRRIYEVTNGLVSPNDWIARDRRDDSAAA